MRREQNDTYVFGNASMENTKSIFNIFLNSIDRCTRRSTESAFL